MRVTTRQYARLVSEWIGSVDWTQDYSEHTRSNARR